MGYSLIMLSGVTPVILFAYMSYVISYHSNTLSGTKVILSEQGFSGIFEKHFERRMPVRIQENPFGTMHVEGSPNGLFRLCTMKGDEVLVVRKDHLGWAIIRTGSTTENPRQYLIPLILMLERRLYN
jgi:hypothetical protein